MNEVFWRKCSVCKEPINFSSLYYKCSVSSCSKERAPVQFCSVSCWEDHNSILNHKSAGADEYRAPKELEVSREPRKILINSKPDFNSTNHQQDDHEILVVVSKFKTYVKNAHDLSTSGEVIDLLSDELRKLADRAAMKARQDGRKTLMARDF
jgi:hypothetical protein